MLVACIPARLPEGMIRGNKKMPNAQPFTMVLMHIVKAPKAERKLLLMLGYAKIHYFSPRTRKKNQYIEFRTCFSTFLVNYTNACSYSRQNYL
jgi:hypothetical protein